MVYVFRGNFNNEILFQQLLNFPFNDFEAIFFLKRLFRRNHSLICNIPKELDQQHEIAISNNWYERNGKIVNPEKHQAMVLGITDYKFYFPVQNSIHLLGVTVDNNFDFNCHISKICDKVNKQFSVLKRFKSLVIRNVVLPLYKAFVLLHFHYCTLIWHFCGARNSDKLELLNKRILRFIFNDVISSYAELLNKTKTTSLYSGRNHKMLIVVFKSLFVTAYRNLRNCSLFVT